LHRGLANASAEFVEYMNRTEEPLHKPIYIEKEQDGVRVEVALSTRRAKRSGCAATPTTPTTRRAART
jgi:DNA gyrase/topoisomerase IV subunit B